ncbi:hypothetical protein Tcur_2081 [Thermomonospora curvata DSM 43183]|uniref:RNA polymerase alpha subunit C-terminal domain-containing protein n=1 Tax=Thermomonospora curvata (strain ATCC 19995 / DSM 43183 / JCM 3096 / KCTC 9072 / NBRC 15933 / NCIMB 10081 / Henssen B9) TaxID=471852 RepID=D1AES2_THECD|nr:hypothetical protein Tcur_2081 [Thermomonospora curvata DSM 43183]
MTAAATSPSKPFPPAAAIGPGGRVRPVAGDVAVQRWYLQAVVRVYGPWTVSQTISAREWALAIRRVRYATDALADLDARFPGTASGTGRAEVHDHSGMVPVTRDCPLACLGLSRHAANPLRSHLRGRVTVGQVLRLWEDNELQHVRGLGPRRIGEITTALIAAGFVLTPHSHG